MILSQNLLNPLNFLTRVNNLLKMKDFISQVELLENTIFSLVKSIEARDFYTGEHSRRVSDIAVNIGMELGLSEEEILILKKGGAARYRKDWYSRPNAE